MMEDRLYDKYRVFKEPDDDHTSTHPAVTHTYYEQRGWIEGQLMNELEEVQGFVFVLKPSSDAYALLALKVYAELVDHDFPDLANDLREALSAY